MPHLSDLRNLSRQEVGNACFLLLTTCLGMVFAFAWYLLHREAWTVQRYAGGPPDFRAMGKGDKGTDIATLFLALQIGCAVSTIGFFMLCTWLSHLQRKFWRERLSDQGISG